MITQRKGLQIELKSGAWLQLYSGITFTSKKSVKATDERTENGIFLSVNIMKT